MFVKQKVRNELRNSGVIVLACLLTVAAQAEDSDSTSQSLPDGLVVRAPVIPESVQGTLREFNQSLSNDLKPEDNAVVLLVQVFGEEVFAPTLRDDSLAMLGIQSLSATGPRFLYADAYAQSIAPKDEEARRQVELELASDFAKVTDRPWRRTDFPAMADFLKTNGEALDTVVAAASKPRYYAPLLSAESPPRLLSASFLVEHRLPFMSRCLAARALLRIGEGQFPEALQDLIACHKLAFLLASGSPLDVSGAKAHMIGSIAFEAERGILESGRLTGQQAATYLTALQKVPTIPTAELAADKGERAILHQEIEFLKTDADSVKGSFELALSEGAIHPEALSHFDIRIDLAEQRADEIQDDIVEALSIPDREKQIEHFERLKSEFDMWSKRVDAEEIKFAQSLSTDPEAVSRWIGENTAMSLRTNPWQRQFTDDRAHMRRSLTSIGLALLAFRGRHGEYPQSLDELAPEFLPKIPNDPFSRKAFTYVRDSGNRARLICWGGNMQNDAGQNYNDDTIVELR